MKGITGDVRPRTGLPHAWPTEETGTGWYGTADDVGVAWLPDRTPVVISVLSTGRHPDSAVDEPLLAKTARVPASVPVGFQ
ncbi:hypothetical protein [Streptomyces sp. SID3343]|uniref:hypothetical protein n=1 Tax=Streptomyces sp. SID3343 TaxID=2690260 RepID=UPI001F17157A|nr:hypothetical protein [Streptomyces sp. SID3343]